MIKSVYIHIPFCDSICSYCDFCKVLTNSTWIDKYLYKLKEEINNRYNGEVIETIYVGGGTPSSLNVSQLKKLLDIVKLFNISENIEYTFECNIENITQEKLELLYENGVNRLSVGVQTFNSKLLKHLNRNHDKELVFNKIKLMKSMGFNNINIDIIYAIPEETLNNISEDINEFLKLDIAHISTYSLILEPNTNLYIKREKSIDEELDFRMYNLIIDKLESHGYKHYEISNFCKEGFQSKHNLTYWNNNEYYGFGLGASGYINNIRYDNTRSLTKYLNGEYLSYEHILDKNEAIENEFILGLRKIKGINKKNFYNKYNIEIKSIEIVNKLLEENKLIEDENNIYINPKYIYISNDILINFIK